MERTTVADGGIAPDLRDAARGGDLLGRLNDGQLDALLGRATRRIARAGEVLIRRGDANGGLMIVLGGCLRVGTTSVDGREITLRVLGPGEMIGEISLLDGEPASADVQALERTTLLTVSRAHMLALMRADAELCLALMAALCRRLRRVNETAVDLGLHDLATRLSRVLGRLTAEFGIRTADGVAIAVALPQRELAQLVGASREKVNRELRLLEARGVVTRRKGRLVVLRPAALAAATTMSAE